MKTSHLSLPGDEVDLPQGRDIIALQDLVALLLQGRGGQVFAGVAQLPSRIFHPFDHKQVFMCSSDHAVKGLKSLSGLSTGGLSRHLSKEAHRLHHLLLEHLHGCMLSPALWRTAAA